MEGGFDTGRILDGFPVPCNDTLFHVPGDIRNPRARTPFGDNKRLAAVVGPANSCFRFRNGQLLLSDSLLPLPLLLTDHRDHRRPDDMRPGVR